MNLDEARAWADSHRKELLLGGGGAVVAYALYRRGHATQGAAAADVASQEVPVSYADPQAGVDTAGFGYVGVAEDLGGIQSTLNKILGRLPKPTKAKPKPPKKKPKKHPHGKKHRPTKRPPKVPAPPRRQTAAAFSTYPVRTLPGGSAVTHRLPTRAPVPVMKARPFRAARPGGSQ